MLNKKTLGLKAVSAWIVLCLFWQDAGLALVDLNTRNQVDLPSFYIPHDIGLIKENKKLSGQETIINIKDIHDNFGAQQSIVQILENIITNYNVKTIGIEGAEGAVDTSLLASLPYEDFKQNTANFLMQEGKLSAGEFLSAMSDGKIAVYGMDDNRLYEDNLRAYKTNLNRKKNNFALIESLLQALGQYQEAVFSKELIHLNQNGVLNINGTLKFSQRWQEISVLADQYHISYSEYANLKNLMQAMQAEKQIDFKAVNQERQTLMDLLGKYLTRDKLEKLVLQSVAYKLGKISQGSFSSYLLDTAKKENKNVDNYPNLSRYADYMLLYEAIDIDALKDEVKDLESRIRLRLFRNDDEKKLYHYIEEAQIIRDLFDVKLSSASLEYCKKNLKTLNASELSKFLKTLSSKYSISPDAAPDIEAIYKEVPESMRFYELAESRNEALLKNTVQKMRANNDSVACLVTGGFHTRGITELLKEQKMSYIVILPRFTKKTQRPYLTIITNSKVSYREFVESEEVLSTKLQMTAHFFSQAAFKAIQKKYLADPEKNLIVQKEIAVAKELYLQNYERAKGKTSSASVGPAVESAAPQQTSMDTDASADKLAPRVHLFGGPVVRDMEVAFAEGKMYFLFVVNGQYYLMITQLSKENDLSTLEFTEGLLKGISAKERFDQIRNLVQTVSSEKKVSVSLAEDSELFIELLQKSRAGVLLSEEELSDELQRLAGRKGKRISRDTAMATALKISNIRSEENKQKALESMKPSSKITEKIIIQKALKEEETRLESLIPVGIQGEEREVYREAIQILEEQGVGYQSADAQMRADAIKKARSLIKARQTAEEISQFSEVLQNKKISNEYKKEQRLKEALEKTIRVGDTIENPYGKFMVLAVNRDGTYKAYQSGGINQKGVTFDDVSKSSLILGTFIEESKRAAEEEIRATKLERERQEKIREQEAVRLTEVKRQADEAAKIAAAKREKELQAQRQAEAERRAEQAKILADAEKRERERQESRLKEAELAAEKREAERQAAELVRQKTAEQRSREKELIIALGLEESEDDLEVAVSLAGILSEVLQESQKAEDSLSVAAMPLLIERPEGTVEESLFTADVTNELFEIKDGIMTLDLEKAKDLSTSEMMAFLSDSNLFTGDKKIQRRMARFLKFQIRQLQKAGITADSVKLNLVKNSKLPAYFKDGVLFFDFDLLSAGKSGQFLTTMLYHAAAHEFAHQSGKQEQAVLINDLRLFMRSSFRHRNIFLAALEELGFKNRAYYRLLAEGHSIQTEKEKSQKSSEKLFEEVMAALRNGDIQQKARAALRPVIAAQNQILPKLGNSREDLAEKTKIEARLKALEAMADFLRMIEIQSKRVNRLSANLSAESIKEMEFQISLFKKERDSLDQKLNEILKRVVDVKASINDSNREENTAILDVLFRQALDLIGKIEEANEKIDRSDSQLKRDKTKLQSEKDILDRMIQTVLSWNWNNLSSEDIRKSQENFSNERNKAPPAEETVRQETIPAADTQTAIDNLKDKEDSKEKIQARVAGETAKILAGLNVTREEAQAGMRFEMTRTAKNAAVGNEILDGAMEAAKEGKTKINDEAAFITWAESFLGLSDQQAIKDLKAELAAMDILDNSAVIVSAAKSKTFTDWAAKNYDPKKSENIVEVAFSLRNIMRSSSGIKDEEGIDLTLSDLSQDSGTMDEADVLTDTQFYVRSTIADKMKALMLGRGMNTGIVNEAITDDEKLFQLRKSFLEKMDIQDLTRILRESAGELFDNKGSAAQRLAFGELVFELLSGYKMTLPQRIMLSMFIQGRSVGLMAGGGKTVIYLLYHGLMKISMGEAYSGVLFAENDGGVKNFMQGTFGDCTYNQIAQAFGLTLVNGNALHADKAGSGIKDIGDTLDSSDQLLVVDFTTAAHINNLAHRHEKVEDKVLYEKITSKAGNRVGTVDEMHFIAINKNAAVLGEQARDFTTDEMHVVAEVATMLYDFQKGEMRYNTVVARSREEYLEKVRYYSKGGKGESTPVLIVSLESSEEEMFVSESLNQKLTEIKAASGGSKIIRSVLLGLAAKEGEKYKSSIDPETGKRIVAPVHGGESSTNTVMQDTNYQAAIALKIIAAEFGGRLTQNQSTLRDLIEEEATKMVRLSNSSMQVAVTDAIRMFAQLSVGASGTVDGLEDLANVHIGAEVTNINASKIELDSYTYLNTRESAQLMQNALQGKLNEEDKRRLDTLQTRLADPKTSKEAKTDLIFFRTLMNVSEIHTEEGVAYVRTSLVATANAETRRILKSRLEVYGITVETIDANTNDKDPDGVTKIVENASKQSILVEKEAVVLAIKEKTKKFKDEKKRLADSNDEASSARLLEINVEISKQESMLFAAETSLDQVKAQIREGIAAGRVKGKVILIDKLGWTGRDYKTDDGLEAKERKIGADLIVADFENMSETEFIQLTRRNRRQTTKGDRYLLFDEELIDERLTDLGIKQIRDELILKWKLASSIEEWYKSVTAGKEEADTLVEAKLEGAVDYKQRLALHKALIGAMKLADAKKRLEQAKLDLEYAENKDAYTPTREEMQKILELVRQWDEAASDKWWARPAKEGEDLEAHANAIREHYAHQYSEALKELFKNKSEAERKRAQNFADQMIKQVNFWDNKAEDRWWARPAQGFEKDYDHAFAITEHFYHQFEKALESAHKNTLEAATAEFNAAKMNLETITQSIETQSKLALHAKLLATRQISDGARFSVGDTLKNRIVTDPFKLIYQMELSKEELKSVDAAFKNALEDKGADADIEARLNFLSGSEGFAMKQALGALVGAEKAWLQLLSSKGFMDEIKNDKESDLDFVLRMIKAGQYKSKIAQEAVSVFNQIRKAKDDLETWARDTKEQRQKLNQAKAKLAAARKSRQKSLILEAQNEVNAFSRGTVSDFRDAITRATGFEGTELEGEGVIYRIIKNTFEVADATAERDIVLTGKNQGGLLVEQERTIQVYNRDLGAKEKYQEAKLKIRATEQGVWLDIQEAVKEMSTMKAFAVSIQGGLRIIIQDEGGVVLEHLVKSEQLGRAFPEGQIFEGVIQPGVQEKKGRSVYFSPVISTLGQTTDTIEAAKAFNIHHDSLMEIIRSMAASDAAKKNVRAASLKDLALSLGMSWDDFIKALNQKIILFSRALNCAASGELEDLVFSKEIDELRGFEAAFKPYLVNEPDETALEEVNQAKQALLSVRAAASQNPDAEEMKEALKKAQKSYEDAMKKASAQIVSTRIGIILGKTSGLNLSGFRQDDLDSRNLRSFLISKAAIPRSVTSKELSFLDKPTDVLLEDAKKEEIGINYNSNPASGSEPLPAPNKLERLAGLYSTALLNSDADDKKEMFLQKLNWLYTAMAFQASESIQADANATDTANQLANQARFAELARLVDLSFGYSKQLKKSGAAISIDRQVLLNMLKDAAKKAAAMNNFILAEQILLHVRSRDRRITADSLGLTGLKQKASQQAEAVRKAADNLLLAGVRDAAEEQKKDPLVVGNPDAARLELLPFISYKTASENAKELIELFAQAHHEARGQGALPKSAAFASVLKTHARYLKKTDLDKEKTEWILDAASQVSAPRNWLQSLTEEFSSSPDAVFFMMNVFPEAQRRVLDKTISQADRKAVLSLARIAFGDKEIADQIERLLLANPGNRKEAEQTISRAQRIINNYLSTAGLASGSADNYILTRGGVTLSGEVFFHVYEAQDDKKIDIHTRKIIDEEMAKRVREDSDKPVRLLIVNQLDLLEDKGTNVAQAEGDGTLIIFKSRIGNWTEDNVVPKVSNEEGDFFEALQKDLKRLTEGISGETFLLTKDGSLAFVKPSYGINRFPKASKNLSAVNSEFSKKFQQGNRPLNPEDPDDRKIILEKLSDITDKKAASSKNLSVLFKTEFEGKSNREIVDRVVNGFIHHEIQHIVENRSGIADIRQKNTKGFDEYTEANEIVTHLRSIVHSETPFFFMGQILTYLLLQTSGDGYTNAARNILKVLVDEYYEDESKIQLWAGLKREMTKKEVDAFFKKAVEPDDPMWNQIIENIIKAEKNNPSMLQRLAAQGMEKYIKNEIENANKARQKEKTETPDKTKATDVVKADVTELPQFPVRQDSLTTQGEDKSETLYLKDPIQIQQEETAFSQDQIRIRQSLADLLNEDTKEKGSGKVSRLGDDLDVALAIIGPGDDFKEKRLDQKAAQFTYEMRYRDKGLADIQKTFKEGVMALVELANKAKTMVKRDDEDVQAADELAAEFFNQSKSQMPPGPSSKMNFQPILGRVFELNDDFPTDAETEENITKVMRTLGIVFVRPGAYLLAESLRGALSLNAVNPEMGADFWLASKVGGDEVQEYFLSPQKGQKTDDPALKSRLESFERFDRLSRKRFFSAQEIGAAFFLSDYTALGLREKSSYKVTPLLDSDRESIKALTAEWLDYVNKLILKYDSRTGGELSKWLAYTGFSPERIAYRQAVSEYRQGVYKSVIKQRLESDMSDLEEFLKILKENSYTFEKILEDTEYYKEMIESVDLEKRAIYESIESKTGEPIFPGGYRSIVKSTLIVPPDLFRKVKRFKTANGFFSDATEMTFVPSDPKFKDIETHAYSSHEANHVSRIGYFDVDDDEGSIEHTRQFREGSVGATYSSETSEIGSIKKNFGYTEAQIEEAHFYGDSSVFEPTTNLTETNIDIKRIITANDIQDMSDSYLIQYENRIMTYADWLKASEELAKVKDSSKIRFAMQIIDLGETGKKKIYLKTFNGKTEVRKVIAFVSEDAVEKKKTETNENTNAVLNQLELDFHALNKDDKNYASSNSVIFKKIVELVRQLSSSGIESSDPALEKIISRIYELTKKVALNLEAASVEEISPQLQDFYDLSDNILNLAGWRHDDKLRKLFREMIDHYKNSTYLLLTIADPSVLEAIKAALEKTYTRINQPSLKMSLGEQVLAKSVGFEEDFLVFQGKNAADATTLAFSYKDSEAHEKAFGRIFLFHRSEKKNERISVADTQMHLKESDYFENAFTAKEIVQFFAFYNDDLSEEETALKQQLIELGLISQSPEGYNAAKNVVIVSWAQDIAKKKGLRALNNLVSRLINGLALYELDEAYQEGLKNFLNSQMMSTEEKEALETFFNAMGYSVSSKPTIGPFPNPSFDELARQIAAHSLDTSEFIQSLQRFIAQKEIKETLEKNPELIEKLGLVSEVMAKDRKIGLLSPVRTRKTSETLPVQDMVDQALDADIEVPVINEAITDKEKRPALRQLIQNQREAAVSLALEAGVPSNLVESILRENNAIRALLKMGERFQSAAIAQSAPGARLTQTSKPFIVGLTPLYNDRGNIKRTELMRRLSGEFTNAEFAAVESETDLNRLSQFPDSAIRVLLDLKQTASSMDQIVGEARAALRVALNDASIQDFLLTYPYLVDWNEQNIRDKATLPVLEQIYFVIQSSLENAAPIDVDLLLQGVGLRQNSGDASTRLSVKLSGFDVKKLVSAIGKETAVISDPEQFVREFRDVLSQYKTLLNNSSTNKEIVESTRRKLEVLRLKLASVLSNGSAENIGKTLEEHQAIARAQILEDEIFNLWKDLAEVDSSFAGNRAVVYDARFSEADIQTQKYMEKIFASLPKTPDPSRALIEKYVVINPDQKQAGFLSNIPGVRAIVLDKTSKMQNVQQAVNLPAKNIAIIAQDAQKTEILENLRLEDRESRLNYVVLGNGIEEALRYAPPVAQLVLLQRYKSDKAMVVGLGLELASAWKKESQGGWFQFIEITKINISSAIRALMRNVKQVGAAA